MLRSVVHMTRTNWQNRQLIKDLIKRDFKLKYLGSILGSYWNFVHPIAMITIYTVIFSQLMHARIGNSQGPFSFTIYLCAGLLPWTAFSEMVTRGTVTFHENANFIKKVSFPKEILQTVVTGSSLLTLLISMSIYVVLIHLVSSPLTWVVVFLPFALICQILLASGLGMILSVLNVFFRDIQQFISIFFQVWFWLTPIVYLADLIPEKFRFFLLLNPMYYIIKIYQKIFYEKVIPDSRILAMALICAIFMFISGCYTVWHFKDELVDEL